MLTLVVHLSIFRVAHGQSEAPSIGPKAVLTSKLT